MERVNLTSRLLYRNDDTGLCLLSDVELKGNYPNWFNDQDVNQHNSHWSRPNTAKQVFQFVESLTHDTSKLVFAIYAIKDQVHIGNVSLQSIDPMNQMAEIAFLFGEKAYWGKGHAVIAANLIMQHGFRHLNLHRIYLGCLSKNIAMNKLAKKLGFVEEGLRRKSAFNNGEFQDVIEYGILKNEFKALIDC